MKGDLSGTSFGLQWSPKGFSFAVPISHDVCRALCADTNLHIRIISIFNAICKKTRRRKVTSAMIEDD